MLIAVLIICLLGDVMMAIILLLVLSLLSDLHRLKDDTRE